MRVKSWRWKELRICVAASSLFLFCTVVYGQDASQAAPSSSPASEREAAPEIRALADLIRVLQAQVQTLNSQLSELRTEEQRTSEEARDLRRELDLAKGRMPSTSNGALESLRCLQRLRHRCHKVILLPAGQRRPGPCLCAGSSGPG